MSKEPRFGEVIWTLLIWLRFTKPVCKVLSTLMGEVKLKMSLADSRFPQFTETEFPRPFFQLTFL